MKKIEFKKISITNFLSFGKTQEYVFKNGITLVGGVNKDRLDDPNGSGKTSLAASVMFALFGKTTKDASVGSLVNRVAKKNGVVRLDMEVDGHPFAIIRGVKPSFVKIEEDGEEKQFAGIKPTDQYIADKIGTDYTTFRNTVMMSLNNTQPFLQQAADAKRKFIESLFNIEFIRDMVNLLKEENASKLQEYKEIGLSIDSTRTAMERLEDAAKSEREYKERAVVEARERYEEAKRKADEAEAEIAGLKEPESTEAMEGKFAEMRRELSDLVSAAGKMQADVNLAENRLSVAKDKAKTLRSEADAIENWVSRVNEGLKERGYVEDFWTMYKNLEMYEDEISRLTTRKAELSAIPAANQSIIRQLNRQKSELLSGDKCPTCGHVFTVEEKADMDGKARKFDERIAEVERENDEARKSADEVQKELDVFAAKLKVAKAGRDKRVDDVGSKRSEADEIEKGIPSLEVDLENAKRNFESSRDASEKFRETVNAFEVRLRSAESEVKMYRMRVQTVEYLRKTEREYLRSYDSAVENAKVSSSEDGIAKYKDELVALDERSKSVEFDLEAYGCAKRVLGDDGFRAELVGRIVAALNSKVNEYLVRLDAPVTLTIDKYFSDSIVDMTTGEVVEYGLLSGGEQRRVDLAMLLAFMDIRSMQGDAKFSMLFFDEIFDSALSGQACKRLMEILRGKNDEDAVSSMVISHRRELADDDNVDHRVLVTKTGGFSTISEE